MTTVLSVRVPVKKLSALDRRARRQGLDRTGLVLRLIDRELEAPEKAGERKFRSADLQGRLRVGRGSDNAAVRKALAQRHEKHR